MKLFLFGGAELDIPRVSPAVVKRQIKEVITKLNLKSILHIPFARLHPHEEEWKEGWFREMMQDTIIEVLDARNELDIDKAPDSVIFINGGRERKQLVDSILGNSKILNRILNAGYIVSESAGSMAMGECMTADRAGAEIIKGIGILKNTIIEVHYTEKNRQKLLEQDLQKSGMKYGIGIDCATALVVDPSEFPSKWEKIGVGSVYIKTAK